jgi:hypothetical protein
LIYIKQSRLNDLNILTKNFFHWLHFFALRAANPIDGAYAHADRACGIPAMDKSGPSRTMARSPRNSRAGK